jgi:TonB family protein
MKLLTSFLLTFCAFVIPPPANAQDTHVHTRYVKESDTTVTETDWMYIINTPQQFMQLGLVARQPNEQSSKSPRKINLAVWSFSREVMYREDKSHTLNINTDGENWSVSPEAYLVFKGETENGQDIFWAEKRQKIGRPSLLPKTAQVKAQGSINGLFMEQIFVELKPDQLLKIAKAGKVEMQLGATRLEISNDYLSTIRAFNNRVVLGAQPATESAEQTASTKPQKPGEPIDVGVVNGKALRLPRPEYPSLARGARASGSVNVLVTIDETGKVIAARAISGHPLLREASEAAAREARFQPPMISGKPVKVTGIIIYNFMQ